MPIERIHTFPNTGRAYQSPPNANQAIVATITASQFRSPSVSNDIASLPSSGLEATYPRAGPAARTPTRICLLCWSILLRAVRRYGEGGEWRRREEVRGEVRAADLQRREGQGGGRARGRRADVR